MGRARCEAGVEFECQDGAISKKVIAGRYAVASQVDSGAGTIQKREIDEIGKVKSAVINLKRLTTANINPDMYPCPTDFPTL